jgi:hypothetical protein
VAEQVRFSEWRVSNMVAVADCAFPIRLEGLHLSHAKFSSYVLGRLLGTGNKPHLGQGMISTLPHTPLAPPPALECPGECSATSQVVQSSLQLRAALGERVHLFSACTW